MKMTVDCAGMLKTRFLKLIINRKQTTVNFYCFFFVSLGSASWWCCTVHQHHRIIFIIQNIIIFNIQMCAKIFYSLSDLLLISMHCQGSMNDKTDT